MNSYHADSSAPACAMQPRSTFPTNCDTGTVPGCYVYSARYQNGEDCGANVNAGPVFGLAGPGYGLVYQMAGRDYLKAFRYDTTTHHLDERPFLTSSVRAVEGRRAGSARSPPTGRATPSSGSPIRSATDSGKTCPGDWRLSTPPRWASCGTTTAATCSPSSPRRRSPAAASSGPTLSGKVVVYGRGARRPRRGRWPAARWIDSRLCSGPAPLRRPRPWARRRRREVPPGGGESGFLGRPVFDARPVQDAAGGWYRDFQGVIIGDVPSTVAVRHYVRAPSPVLGRHPWPGLGTPARFVHLLVATYRRAHRDRRDSRQLARARRTDGATRLSGCRRRAGGGGGRVCRFAAGPSPGRSPRGPSCRSAQIGDRDIAEAGRRAAADPAGHPFSRWVSRAPPEARFC